MRTNNSDYSDTWRHFNVMKMEMSKTKQQPVQSFMKAESRFTKQYSKPVQPSVEPAVSTITKQYSNSVQSPMLAESRITKQDSNPVQSSIVIETRIKKQDPKPVNVSTVLPFCCHVVTCDD